MTIKRFIKVTDGLYRGSAPTPEDVVNLYRHFGIRKIVSLDLDAADKIDRITKALGIKHVIIPINNRDYDPIITLVSQNLKSLLLDDGPTFVHCHAGKDRTGMVIAMFQCKYMGMSYEQAMQEAKKIGFGIGLDPRTAKFYMQIVKNYCSSASDTNNADVVDNSRPGDDWRGSVLDSADMSSFAPYMSTDRQYPYDSVYNTNEQQYSTRNNHGLETVQNDEESKSDAPLVGIYNSDAVMLGGAGPVEPGGSFSDA